MRIFRDFESYNAYVGLQEPLDNNIDIGFYDAKKLGLAENRLEYQRRGTAYYKLLCASWADVSCNAEKHPTKLNS